jgi:outer membrane protein OmpA-like peptidoglycan-associated protein
MNKARSVLLAACLSLGACAEGDRIVLLSDPDGKVGKVEVSTAIGSQLLTEARSETVVQAGKVPTAPRPLTEETIRTVWRDALAAMPTPVVVMQLYFRTGTSQLTDEGLAELSKMRAVVAARPHPLVLAVGHADAVGSDEVNVRISRERAQMVRDLLVKDGLPPSAILVSSHGKRNPLVPTPDGVAEPRNRRVTVTVQ